MPDDGEIAATQRHARAAAATGRPVTDCPHEVGRDAPPIERVLASRWVSAYRRAGGGQPLDYIDSEEKTAAGMVRLVREAYASDEGQRTGTTYTAPHAAAGSPQGGQFTATNNGGGKKPPPKAAKPAPRPAGKPAPAAKAAPPPPSSLQQAVSAQYANFGILSEKTPAGDQRTKNVQTLMRSLGMQVPTDGHYDKAMTAQVKDIQNRLGMNPTGRITSSLMKTLQRAAVLSPCAKEAIVFSAADLVRRVREGFNPDQRRAPGGTGIGGRWVSMGAVLTALRGSGHHDAAKALRAHPPSGPRRTSTRWSPSERELKGHTRASADAAQLRDRIATLDEDLKAPQFDGGRMSHPAERRKAEMTRAELQRQLAELEPRVAAGDERRRQHPDVYGDTPGVTSAPSPSEALSSDPAVRAVQVENRIRAAYNELPKGADIWLGFADLREHASLRDIPRAEVDAALLRGAKRGDMQIEPIDNRRGMSQRDRDAALHIGGDPNLPREMIHYRSPDGKVGHRAGPAPLLPPPSAQPHPSPAGVGHQDSRTPSPAPGGTALSSDPATRAAQVDNRLRAAYNDLPKAPGGWVGIADLRDAMGDVPRADQDAALTRLIDASLPGSPRIIPVANTKALKPRDRAAAIKIGPDESHAVSFNNGHGAAPTVPVPGGTGPVPIVPGAAPKAPRKAAAKVATAKANAEPPASIAARLHASTDENEARAMLSGLTVKQLNEVAAAAGLERQSGRKAEIVDRISYQTVGHRVDSAVLRTRGGSTSAAPLVGPRPLPDVPGTPTAPATPRKAADRVKAAKAVVPQDPGAMEQWAIDRERRAKEIQRERNAAKGRAELAAATQALSELGQPGTGGNAPRADDIRRAEGDRAWRRLGGAGDDKASVAERMRTLKVAELQALADRWGFPTKAPMFVGNGKTMKLLSKQALIDSLSAMWARDRRWRSMPHDPDLPGA